MTPADIVAAKAKLEAEVEAARSRLAKHEDAARAERKCIEDAQAQLWRLDVLSLVNVPNAVQMAFRDTEAGNKPGTVLDVKRTRALVDFGDRGRWRVLLGELRRASDSMQGFAVTWGAR